MDRDKYRYFINSLARKDIIVVIIIFITSFASFGLGRLSVDANENSTMLINRSPISYIDSGSQGQLSLDDSSAAEISNEFVSGGKLVASALGGKYHFPWCSGAKRIKNENKIFFNTFEEARSKGYEPAMNCKGLK